jgi:hypothetical protein
MFPDAVSMVNAINDDSVESHPETTNAYASVGVVAWNDAAVGVGMLGCDRGRVAAASTVPAAMVHCHG